MKRSNTAWTTEELAWIRTACMRIDAGESIYQQIEWLYGTHTKGRTRESIRKRINKMRGVNTDIYREFVKGLGYMTNSPRTNATITNIQAASGRE